MADNELIEAILRQIKQPLWDGWYIQEKLGTGTYSAVYKAIAQNHNRLDVAAVKIEPVLPDKKYYSDDKQKMAAIEERRALTVSESELMAKLRNCPNIVTYQDDSLRELYIDGKLEGYFFLIRMEYMSCISNMLREQSFDFSEDNVMKLAADIGNGINAAHELGIIHRDIKPDNFYCDQYGIYKLGDFNVTKKKNVPKKYSAENSYLAPEVFFSRATSRTPYTRQSDIYSFGLCLYQMMNDMYMPLEREMPVDKAIASRICGNALPPPKNASPEFARIILKACSYNTINRYQNIKEFLCDLNGIARSRVTVNNDFRPLKPIRTHNVQRTITVSAAQHAERYTPTAIKLNGNFSAQAPKITAKIPVLNQDAVAVKEKKTNIIPAAIFLIALIAVLLGVFTIHQITSGKNDSGTKIAEAVSDHSNITGISSNKDTININIHEKVNVKDVSFPDKISKKETEEGKQLDAGYSVDSVLIASDDQLILTVNQSATEELKWDAPEDLKVSVKKENNNYIVTFNASKYVDKNAECKVVFYGNDPSVYKEIKVNITNDGPFKDDLMLRSSNDKVIRFYKENGVLKYIVSSTGMVDVNWMYNGEILHTCKLEITK